MLFMFLLLSCCGGTRRHIKELAETDLGKAQIRPSRDVHILAKELVHGLDQIMVKIEVVVGHLRWQNEEGLPFTLLVELLGVVIGNQRIFLTMHNEGRTLYMRH